MDSVEISNFEFRANFGNAPNQANFEFEIRNSKFEIASGPLTATRENQLCPIREERYAAGRLSP